MAETNENKTFDFVTAVKYLQEGKSVRCVDWKKDIYIRANRDGIIRHFSSRTGRPVRITFTFFVSHFISDWELYNG
ncbi:MAG: hypothetical protein PHE67_07950 [Campylobacterales bacterium]|nr:hypothetical protein [Campylobacterales bacterium]